MSLAEYNYQITTKDVNVSWNDNEYKILHEGTGGGTFSRDSSQASIAYICEYIYLDKFIDVVMGKTTKVSSQLKRSATAGNFDAVNGSLPEEHPNISNFFASSLELEPLGTSQNTQAFGPQYKKAKVTVVFRPLNYIVAKDGVVASENLRFTTKTCEGATEFQTSLGFFKFVTSKRVLDLTPGFIISSTKFTYTWHQIPAVARSDGKPELGKPPNMSTIQPLVGSINSVAFDGNSPGTTLFVNYGARLVLPSCATDNNFYWDIIYITAFRDYGTSSTPKVTGEHIGFNYAYDPLQQAWDLYTVTGETSGKTMYPYSDISALFSVGW